MLHAKSISFFHPIRKENLSFDTKLPKDMNNLTDYMAVGLAEGFEEGTEEQVIEAWQHLHDTGLAYKLQGWFGRTAQSLIEEGVINE